ncbi:MAG TPA: phage baseplate assembly protein V [Pyrinomonadaceae bacterium]|nr:phage baseplate assembly protein V [Pyrinomonadaceae bacterium]
MSNGKPKFYGIYRASVVNNIDPMQKGRIQVIVLDPGGFTPSSWCNPCVPFTGKQSGAFVLPQIGSGVWIQFENGDPDQPVWMGGWYGSAAEVPALALAGNPISPSIVLQTGLQNTLMISDMAGPTGGFLLKTTLGAFISINDTTGITISDGKGGMITMIGGLITINQGALLIK